MSKKLLKKLKKLKGWKKEKQNAGDWFRVPRELPRYFDVKSCMEAFSGGWDAVVKHQQEPDCSPVKSGLRTEVEIRMANILHEAAHRVTGHLPHDVATDNTFRITEPTNDDLLRQCSEAACHVMNEAHMDENYPGCESFLRTRNLADLAEYVQETMGVPRGPADLLRVMVLNQRLLPYKTPWGLRWGDTLASKKSLGHAVEQVEQAFPEIADQVRNLMRTTLRHMPPRYLARKLYDLLKNLPQQEGGGEGPGGDGNQDPPPPGKDGGAPSLETLEDIEGTLSLMDLEDGAADSPLRRRWSDRDEKQERGIKVCPNAYKQSKMFFQKAIELMLETQHANRLVRPEDCGVKIKGRHLPHALTDGRCFVRNDESPGELLNLAVLLDRSGSIINQFHRMSGMAKALLDSVEHYGYEARLWMFGQTTTPMLCSERLPLGSEWYMEPNTMPAQSIAASTDWLSKQPGRRIVVIITDGEWEDGSICYSNIRMGRGHRIEYLIIHFGQMHPMDVPSYVMRASGKTVPEVAANAVRALRVR